MPEHKKRLLKAKIAVALHDKLGRVPKTEEIEQVFLLSRVMYKAVLGLHLPPGANKNNRTTCDLLILPVSQNSCTLS